MHNQISELAKGSEYRYVEVAPDLGYLLRSADTPHHNSPIQKCVFVVNLLGADYLMIHDYVNNLRAFLPVGGAEVDLRSALGLDNSLSENEKEEPVHASHSSE